MAKNNPTLDLQFEEKISGPVTCLGMEFESDEARRVYFTEQLKEKLKDPEFRKIEGFPIGTDESILELSDPPYYTACPNPWIADFIDEWEAEKPEKPADYHYHREPFAADVSEGKNDPLYKLPSYHTKVPPKAIEEYILHYTEPGDIILDAFCGTGMTGVAASQISKNPNEKRHAILVDLSTAAAFTASIMNSPLQREYKTGLDGRLNNFIENEILPMYECEVNHQVKSFDYAVWSDWGTCPNCNAIFRLYDVVVDYEKKKILSSYNCPECHAELSSRSQKKLFTTVYDPWIKETKKVVKSSMVLISNRQGNRALRTEATKQDVLKYEAEAGATPVKTPEALLYSHMTHERNNLPKYWGITHINQFYTKRNYLALDKVAAISDSSIRKPALFAILSTLENNATKRNRFYVDGRRPKGSPVGPLSNTLFIPAIQVETNIGKKIQTIIKNAHALQERWHDSYSVVSNQSATQLYSIPKNTIDFIFTDPPFGGNINYSEQNILAEWWIGITTNNKQEAITNCVQKKGIFEYQTIMTKCFEEYYRVLKPGKWMVVEFHNSSNAIWTTIQHALEVAGFIVSTVDVLDKIHSTMHQDHKTAAVDKDLAISVYKPDITFEKQFILEEGTEDGAWEFIRSHLSRLPIFKKKDNQGQVISERQQYLLFDRMVAFHFQRNITVPLSASKFYAGLTQRFSERDEMYFLPEQVNEYDKKRLKVDKVAQESLFVFDESSAIRWLQQQLKKKPQTTQDLTPQFMQETSGWSKNETMLELSTLLEENFLIYGGQGRVPEQIHTYLSTNWKDMRNLNKEDHVLIKKAQNRWYVPDPNKAGDLEKVREKSLLKEFEEYKAEKKKLKLFRIEAVRAGFKKAWQERDYGTIIAIAEKIPNNVLEEDPKLLMWYDQSVTRRGDE